MNSFFSFRICRIVFAFVEFGTNSFISVIIVFLSGGLAAISVASNSPFAGMIEWLTIGAFLQWLFVIALKLSSAEATR